MLWPIFGSMNQLLAGRSLLVITVWLARKKLHVWVTLLPMLFMLVMTGWSLSISMYTFWIEKNMLLLIIGALTVVLEIWMIIEALAVIKKAGQKITE